MLYLPRASEIGIDGAVSIHRLRERSTGRYFWLLPAIQGSRSDRQSVLSLGAGQQRNRLTSPDRAAWWWTEVAVALIL